MTIVLLFSCLTLKESGQMEKHVNCGLINLNLKADLEYMDTRPDTENYSGFIDSTTMDYQTSDNTQSHSGTLDSGFASGTDHLNGSMMAPSISQISDQKLPLKKRKIHLPMDQVIDNSVVANDMNNDKITSTPDHVLNYMTKPMDLTMHTRRHPNITSHIQLESCRPNCHTDSSCRVPVIYFPPDVLTDEMESPYEHKITHRYHANVASSAGDISLINNRLLALNTRENSATPTNSTQPERTSLEKTKNLFHRARTNSPKKVNYRQHTETYTRPFIGHVDPPSYTTRAPHYEARDVKPDVRHSPKPDEDTPSRHRPTVPRDVNPDVCRAVAEPDDDGDLPLHVAVVQENEELVDRLLQIMSYILISVDTINNLKQTPLHLATIMKNTTIMAKLLNAGASPNIPDRQGHTCCHLAVKYNNAKCLEAVFEHSKVKVDIDAKNYDGLTALHRAVQLGHVNCASLLLKKFGAEMNIQDGKSGKTPLYLAFECEQTDCVNLLIHHGADVNIPTYSGTTVQQAASSRGQILLAQIIDTPDEELKNSSVRELQLKLLTKPRSRPRPQASSNSLPLTGTKRTSSTASSNSAPLTSPQKLSMQSQTYNQSM